MLCHSYGPRTHTTPRRSTAWRSGGKIVRGQLLGTDLPGRHLLLQDTSSLSLDTHRRVTWVEPPQHAVFFPVMSFRSFRGMCCLQGSKTVRATDKSNQHCSPDASQRLPDARCREGNKLPCSLFSPHPKRSLCQAGAHTALGTVSEHHLGKLLLWGALQACI